MFILRSVFSQCFEQFDTVRGAFFEGYSFGILVKAFLCEWVSRGAFLNAKRVSMGFKHNVARAGDLLRFNLDFLVKYDSLEGVRPEVM